MRSLIPNVSNVNVRSHLISTMRLHIKVLLSDSLPTLLRFHFDLIYFTSCYWHLEQSITLP